MVGIKGKLILRTMMVLWLVWGCETSDTKEEPKDTGLVSRPTPGSSDLKRGQSLTHSLSNNPLTNRVVSRSNAKEVANRLRAQVKGLDEKSKDALISLVAAQRLAGDSMEDISKTVRLIADIELKSGVNRDVADIVKLEVGLAALFHRNYGMAEFMLEPLLQSKTSSVKAGAANGLGVLASIEGRTPEAVQYWQEALKVEPGYQAALLNLGFTSLEFGDIDTANRMLTRLPEDWFSLSGLIVVNRLRAKNDEVDRLCQVVLRQKPNHKMTLFNCGLHEWQAKKNAAKAREMIDRALKSPGGPQSWEEKGYRVLEDIKG